MPRPTARICITGSELTRGETKDINGSFLGAHLTALGVDVREILVLPDDPAHLAASFRESIERADIVLASGGLGPTADDHTVRVLAGVVGRRYVEDPEARRRMRDRVLARVGSDDKIPANYYKQAEVVEGSTVLLNPVGLAPGCLVETPRGFVAVLPGVPVEMRAMFSELVAPELIRRFTLTPPRVYRAKILGIGESWAESRIQSLGIDFDRVEYGISAKPGELLIKLIAHAIADHPAIDDARRRLEAEFGAAFLPLPEGLVVDTGDPFDVDHSRLVHEALLASGKTVATAESCTGGLVAKLLTDHGGSSAYFLGSIVAYHNDVKSALVGVDANVLRDHGAVSEPVCRALAAGARRRFGADLGIGITGVAGPGGGSNEKPVGLVYIGLARASRQGDDDIEVVKRRFWGHRAAVRQQAALQALEMLRRAVKGDEPSTSSS